MDDQPAVPEDRAQASLSSRLRKGRSARGQKVTIGFEHEGSYPPGISKTAGRADGVHPAFGGGSYELSPEHRADPGVSSMSVGIDDENRQDPKEYRDDFYKGQTESFVGARDLSPRRSR